MGKQSIQSCIIKNVCPTRVGLKEEQQKLCHHELERRRKLRHIDWNIAINKNIRGNITHNVDMQNLKSTANMKSNKTENLLSRKLLGINNTAQVPQPNIIRSVNKSQVKAPRRTPPRSPNRNRPTPKPYQPRTTINRTAASLARKSPKAKQPEVLLPINTTDAQKKLDNYIKCINDVQTHVDKCIPKLEPMCRQRNLHAVKTVRLDMASVEKLLEHLPNLRVIHLLRDPRGVALSRSGTEWSSGQSGKSDIVKAAAMFCEVASKDIKKRLELEEKYPGAFSQVIYEDFTGDPIKIAKEMYNFLNLTLPASTEKFLVTKTQQKSSSKWQDKLTFHQAYDIHTHCKELFSLVQEPRWLTME